ELGFVGGHVNADRAFGFARLASKAKIECVLHIIALPAAVQWIALEHFKQQPRAASRRVLFFSRGHVAGTHSPAFFFAALAHAYAADRGLRKMPVRFWKSEIRLDRGRLVVCAQPQVFIEWIGINLFARIHLPVRVPDSLELTKSLHQLWAVHLA